MKAIILAAGVGSRLQEVSKGLPKCLCEVGGRTIIEHQIEVLSDNGINKIIVVVGYKAEIVRAAVGAKAEFIENRKFLETNSLYSLWLARDKWESGQFVLMNCDILFHPDILGKLLKGKENALAYDSTSSRGLEQTKVSIFKHRVIDLGKDLPAEATHGESIGLLRFNEDGARVLFQRVSHIVENSGYNEWVIEGVRSACSEIVIQGVNIAGLPWAEIDFPNDLERARKEVYPEIQQDRWKHVIRWRKIRLPALLFFTGLLIFIGWFTARRTEPPSISWETLSPIESKKVKINFIDTGKTQSWWLCQIGGSPVALEVEGPESIRIDVRLLLPPGTTNPGRYVIEISLDDASYDWQTFKATPRPNISFMNYVVADRDRIKFDVPDGKHKLQVGLLAGTGNKLLVRIRRPELDEEKNEEEKD